MTSPSALWVFDPGQNAGRKGRLACDSLVKAAQNDGPAKREVRLSLESSIGIHPQEMVRRANPEQRPAETSGGHAGLVPQPLLTHDRARLRQNPLLAALSAESFDALLPACDVITPGRDTQLFAQGSAAEALHIILDGRVALLGSTPDRRACILEIFAAKEGLIDPSALIDQPYAVTARTIEACRIARLPMRALRILLDHEAGLSRGIVAQLAQHWRLFLRRLEDQKLRSAPQRLASYLCECATAADLNGGHTDNHQAGPVRFLLTEDRRTLASHLGMTPENLSRVIGQLRPLGVSLNGRAVTIDDLAGLRQFGCTAER